MLLVTYLAKVVQFLIINIHLAPYKYPASIRDLHVADSSIRSLFLCRGIHQKIKQVNNPNCRVFSLYKNAT